MSSPKLDLPMLSGYLLGEIISEHDGVRCYPAIRRDTEEKYIVKVLSIPASPTKLEALLLTGALSGKEAALEYFRELSEDVLKQTDILHRLSHQEGFVPYLDSHIGPMEGEVGYNVYLLGTYKRSLSRILSSDTMTHADVINMGLDLCAALAASRRAGYLYVDLKPGNIFCDPEQGFRIGDVGFIALSSLKYASLPDKYRSSYTAPELADDFAVLNPTVDIYALGLVLYQAYNGGVLPFEGAAPDEELPPPIYADYEMAQIILKACHPDPAQRWQEPTQAAQALIGYMQVYGAPEEPIIPPAVQIPEPEEADEIEEFLPEADPEELQREMDALEDAEPEELAFLSTLVSDETAPTEETAAGVSEDVLTEELSEMLAQADALIAHTLPQPPVAPEAIEIPIPEPIVLEPELPEPEEIPMPAFTQKRDIEEEPEDQTANEDDSFLPAPGEDTEPAAQTEAAPAPAEEAEPAPVDEIPEESTADAEEQAAEAPAPQAAPVPGSRPAFRFPWKIAVAALLILALFGLYCYGSYYYENHYIVNIDSLILRNTKDTLTVQVECDVDESLLTVVCTDIFGNATTRPVSGGMASFDQLKANTLYTVHLEIKGTHKLTGQTADSFTTPMQTQILSFIAGMGPEDCSVALSFILEGPDSQNWIVHYSAAGLPTKSHRFTGHNVVITDLQAGAAYTFTLSAEDDLYISGQTQVSCTANNILCAQDLTITACGGGSLTVQWQQPDNGTVQQWNVRCFDGSGYDSTVITSDLSCTFTGLSHSTACTVEVTAVGMDRTVHTSITADPVTVTDFHCQFTENKTLRLSWNSAFTPPEGGWILHYSISGGSQISLALAEPAAELMALPGAVYQFTIEAADGRYVFGSAQSYSVTEIMAFDSFGFQTAGATVSTFLWPEGDDWKWNEIPEERFTATFAATELAGFRIAAATAPEKADHKVQIQFVLFDASGVLVRLDTAEMAWNKLWQDGFCCLQAPALPETPGSYTWCVYFDDCFVFIQELSVI